MIRVIYRWKVKHGREDEFAQAWMRNTKAIRATVEGARGSLLIRSHRDPSEFVAVARWSSLEAWAAARAGGSLSADPEAAGIMQEAAGDPFSAEPYDELADLTDTHEE